MQRPFRFGCQTGDGAAEELRTNALRAEAAGFDVFHTYDHVDHLTDGRVELGLGAGHSFTEYAAIALTSSPNSPMSPVGGRVVLEELSPSMGAGVEAIDDRVDDPGSTIDDVERRVEALVRPLA